MKKTILQFLFLITGLAVSAQNVPLGAGEAILGDNGSGTDTQLLYWNGTNAYYGRNVTGANVNNHYFRTGGLDRMAITSNGYIGVGTNVPLTKLHVYNGSSGNSPHGFSDFSVEDDEHVLMTLMTQNTKYAYYGFADSDDDFVGGIQYNHANDMMYFRVNDRNADMVIANSGNVGIGTTTPDSKLAVNGNIHAKEVRVDLIGWPDYVFAAGYDLPTLRQVEKHIKEKGHLMNIPSAKEVEENGIQLGEMNMKLLEKIEELVLYTLEQEKELQKKDSRMKEIEKKYTFLENRLQKIEQLLNQGQ